MRNRREHVPFDSHFFEKQKQDGRSFSTQEVFRMIFQTNHWSGRESVSGEGAAIDQTHVVRNELPGLLEMYGIDVLLDAPCGDFGWMRFVDLRVTQYIGADVVPEVVIRNREMFGNTGRIFVQLDITSDSLPGADMMFCRDCLVHFSFSDIRNTIENLKRSGIEFLFTTTFPECEENEDITTGDWRPINLQKYPFHFPEPIQLLNEQCSEGHGLYHDKSLGLWRVKDLP